MKLKAESSQSYCERNLRVDTQPSVWSFLEPLVKEKIANRLLQTFEKLSRDM